MMDIAIELAKKQKEISVAEFFERNKQILGFDNLSRSMLTVIKEAVDNSLDACEESEMLPDIYVEIQRVEKNEYKIIVEDNGPGIVRTQIPNIFGKLLYGSRFYAIRQSRGQQGIGISAAVMYAQLTTGKPSLIRSKIANENVSYEYEIIIDTKRNMPEVLRCEPVIWDKDHGIRIELTIKGKYMRGKQSPHDYLRSVAIVNPHAKITLKEPDGSIKVFERVTSKLPKPTIEIKPHPEGIELGTFLKMVKETECYKVVSFLETEFSRTSYRVARDICENAYIDDDLRPKEMNIEQAKRILGAFKHVKIMAPQTECLSPIGETLIKKGLKNVLGTLKPKYYISPVTRKPAVYSGNPFQIEVGMVYGGELPKDQPIQILRFANRVPLLYQQGGCIISTAVQNIDWRRYGFSQPGGYGMPVGPAILLVHVASTKIPFTSEAKEAIADIPEIRNEIEKALKELGRKLQIHLNREVRKQKIAEKFEIVQKVLPIIAEKSSKILGKPVPKLAPVITKIMDIIWVSYTIEYVNPHHIITVEIYNYTSKREKFNLYTVVPPNSLVENSITPSPTKIKENNKIQWHVSINSVEKTTVKFSLYGLDIDEYDDAELYVSGINPAKVVGAEALPGDWELENVQ